MREDIRKKKYKIIYKKVNDMYCNKFMTITQCCKELKITPSQYYKICAELGKKSVNAETKSKKYSKTLNNNSDNNSSQFLQENPEYMIV